MKGNKGKKRSMAHRRHTHGVKHRSFSRVGPGPQWRHDTFGGTIGSIRANLEVIDLTEVTDPVVAEPFFEKENVGTVTFQGPVVQKVAPASTRRTGRSTPWDDADEPWPGRSRSFVYA